MTLRLGFIGAGTIARHHAEAAAAIGTEIAGFCDANEEKARALAAVWPGAIATTSIEDYFSHPEMKRSGGVVIAVPNFLHRDLAIAALEAGKDVLLEKPMAMNAAECNDIIAAANRAQRIVQLGFVCRCSPVVAAVKKLIDDDRLGRIYHIKAMSFRRRGIPGLGGWFTNRALSGGGVLIDLGPHLIDLVMHLTGRPKPLRASGICTSTFGNPIADYHYTEMWAGPPRADGVFDVEDAATALIRFAGGLTCELTMTWAANVPEHKLPSGVIVLAEKAGCFFDIWKNEIHFTQEQNGAVKDVTLTPVEKVGAASQTLWQVGFQEEHRRFAHALETREPPDARATHGREVQQILDALYRSSTEGREIEVNV